MKMNMKLPFLFKPNFDVKLNLQKIGVVVGYYFLSLVPFVFFLIHLNHRMHHLEELEEAVDRLAIRMEQVKQTQKNRNAFMNQYKEVDHYYIDHILEPMVLLKPEVDALKLVYSHSAFQSCENVKNRLEKLTKGGNRLIFSEGNRDVKNGIEEVELTQSRPVEINTSDIKMILSAVEGIPIGNELSPKGRPQLVILGFHLNKKKLSERETYLLEMQLVKRGNLK